MIYQRDTLLLLDEREGEGGREREREGEREREREGAGEPTC